MSCRYLAGREFSGFPPFLLGGDCMLWHERSGVGVRFRTQAKDGGHEQQQQLTAATVGVASCRWKTSRSSTRPKTGRASQRFLERAAQFIRHGDIQNAAAFPKVPEKTPERWHHEYVERRQQQPPAHLKPITSIGIDELSQKKVLPALSWLASQATESLRSIHSGFSKA